MDRVALALMLITFVSTAALPARNGTNNSTAGHSSHSGSRIVGGSTARPGQFPYQASVRSRQYMFDRGHICGGAIITDSVIVSAAHCFYQTYPWTSLYVVAGTTLLDDSTIVEGIDYEKRNVNQVLLHPDYGPIWQDYDIALLFLDRALPLNLRTISTISLQDQSLEAGFPCTVTGWGRVVDMPSVLPKELLYVDVPIVDRDVCDSLYNEADDYSPIIEPMMCAGLMSGGRDACQGDSGGPLVCRGSLTGVVSWGNGCGEKGFPGVYTEVAFVEDWIRENMNSSITSTSSVTSTTSASSTEPITSTKSTRSQKPSPPTPTTSTESTGTPMYSMPPDFPTPAPSYQAGHAAPNVLFVVVLSLILVATLP